jgi:hypothetical protein
MDTVSSVYKIFYKTQIVSVFTEYRVYNATRARPIKSCSRLIYDSRFKIFV